MRREYPSSLLRGSGDVSIFQKATSEKYHHAQPLMIDWSDAASSSGKAFQWLAGIRLTQTRFLGSGIPTLKSARKCSEARLERYKIRS